MARAKEASFGKRNIEVENHWQKLETKDFKINRPTMICLGGNGTIDERKANNFCKMAERLMSLRLDSTNDYSSFRNFDVLGFSYGVEKDGDTVGQFNSDDHCDIVSNLLIPLCVDNNGKRLSLAEACKNFSMLSFFTHCQGAKELNNIMGVAKKQMLIKGFSQEEITNIMSHSFQATYSPIQDEIYVPTVRVDSFTDSLHMGMSRIYRETYGHKLNGVNIFYEPARTFRNQPSGYTHQDLLYIYSSRLLNTTENTDLRNIRDEHYATGIIEMDKNWNNVSGAVNAEVVSKMLGYAMALNGARQISAYINEDFSPISLGTLKTDLDDILAGYNKEDLEAKTSPN
ncbi:MAG: hypothetical protein E7361_03705 [Clostridiales bacterium]|nr:hypothetical protein [Clostridiales bacterium]